MDGKQTTNSDCSMDISFRKTGIVILAAILVGGMLVSFSGCAVSRMAAAKAIPDAGPVVKQP